MSIATDFPHLGFGLGLRIPHYQEILATNPCVDWFEVITENFLVQGGKPLYYLSQFAERYPLVFHGVTLNIGGTDPLDTDYLTQVKDLCERFKPQWISDHLCWTGVGKTHLHDLLPLPYNEESLQHVVSRVKQVQDILGRQIMLENPSTYLNFKSSTMTEWEFMARLAVEADCALLLDVNNVYVSSFNHKFDPADYLNAVPAERVRQFHLAGHSNFGTHIIDTHDETIIDEVWALYRLAAELFPDASTMIERDDNIPPLSELLAELEHARTIAASVEECEA